MSKKSATPVAAAAAPTPAVTARDIATLLSVPELEPIAPWDTFKSIKDAAYQAALVAPPPPPKAPKEPKEGEEAAAVAEPKKPELSDFGIEDARVRRHLDKFGLNAAVTARVSAIKDKYKPVSPDVPAAEMSAEDADLKAAILGARVRIGNGVPAYVRGYCEEIINDLAHAAIWAAIAAKRKIVHDSHIFAHDGFYIRSSKFRALFECLPSFMEAREKYAHIARDATAAQIARSYVTDLSRYITENGQTRYNTARDRLAAFAADVVKEDEDEIAEATAAQGKDARFVFYIRKMLKTIRDSDETFGNLRFSKHLIPLLDNIITDFIMLVAMRALISINVSGAETVSEPVVHSIILGMMATPAAMEQRTILPEMKRETVTKMESKEVGEGADKHTVKEEVTREVLVATVSRPEFMTFIDELYPLTPRNKSKPAEESAAPAPIAPEVAKPAPKSKTAKGKAASVDPAPAPCQAPDPTPAPTPAPKPKAAVVPKFTKGAK